MSPVRNKHFYCFAFLKTICLFALLLIISACGEDSCYYDIQIGDKGVSYKNQIKDLTINAIDNSGKGTGAMISADSEATITVSGYVSMCSDNATKVNSNPNLISGCVDGAKYLCPVGTTMTILRINGGWSICSNKIADVPGICKRTAVCDSDGIGYSLDKNPISKIPFVGDAYGDCAETQGYQDLYCDKDGKETVVFRNSDGSIKTPPMDTRRKCNIAKVKSTNTPLISACWKKVKYLCPSSVTQSNFRETAANCFSGGTVINGSQVCTGDNLTVCDTNGQGFTVTTPIPITDKGTPCADTQGYQHLYCDNDNNETVVFTKKDGSNATAPIATGRKCNLNEAANVSAQTKEWTEIAKNIYPGDMVSFAIAAPTASTPAFLSREMGYVYQNSDNAITVNRWVQNRNQYASLVQITKPDKTKVPDTNCPPELSYDQSIVDYQRSNAKCTGLNNSIPIISYTGAPAYWSIYGQGLVLQGVEAGDCPTDTKCSPSPSIIPFSSTDNQDIYSNFGVLSKLNGNTLDQTMNRNFYSKQKFSKVCAKICDTRGDVDGYKDNLGGYTVIANKQSCMAFNGNPSPCCDDGRGVLEYKFGDNGTWTPVSNSKKYIDDKTFEEIFPISGGQGQELYVRIRSDPTIRQSASGSYAVTINYRELIVSPNGVISNVVEYIKSVLKKIFFGTQGKPGLLEKYFDNLSGNKSYLQYIRILLVLYIILYALAFLMGYVEISQKDLIMRLLKIGVVLTLTQKNGYSFLHDNFFRLFLEGSDALISKTGFTSGCTSANNTFCFADNTFSLLFFNTATWLKLLALLVSSPIGIILVIFLFISIIYFIIGVMTAIVTYLMCILAISVLIFISPIFIPFILFEQTAPLFNNWIKLLTRYALEPVLLIIGLQVLVAIFYAVFKTIMNFTVCWKCMFPINLGAIPKIAEFLKLASVTTDVMCIPFFGPFGFYGEGGASFGSIGMFLPSIILLLIVAHLIKDYHSFITSMIDNIAGESAGLISGGKEKGKGGAADFVRNKLGIGKLENWTGSNLRKGIGAVTGIQFRTEAEKAQKDAELDETAKRKGLRAANIDLDTKKFNDITNNLSKGEAGEAMKKAREAIEKEAKDTKEKEKREKERKEREAKAEKEKEEKEAKEVKEGKPEKTKEEKDKEAKEKAEKEEKEKEEKEKETKAKEERDKKQREELEKAAAKLGSSMFQNLATDRDAYKGFVSGMDALRAMDSNEVDKLVAANPKLSGIKDMHEVLNGHVARNSFADLSSKNNVAKYAAMERIGKAMFTNKEVSDSLLDKDTSQELSKKIFELGRESRAKVN